jgi:sec-independent protein translocase protein TatB
MPAIEPPVAPKAPATSKIDAPEAPIPETFTEADAHAAAAEPLAITREAQRTPQDTAPATADVLKDAKAS